MKISIIVPVCNAQVYLSDMLNSILSQSYRDWELLLIVSKSRDNSLEICQNYARRCSKIRVFEENLHSPGVARNKALSEAQADYIMFVDADDYLANEEILSRLFWKAQESGADIVVANYMRLWKGKQLNAVSHVSFSEKSQNTEDFRFQGFFSVGTLSYVWGKLYRKSFIEQNHICFADIAYAEDKLFNMQCCLSGAKYAFIDEIGYIYRRNEQSVSFRYNPHLKECWLEIATLLRRYAKEIKVEDKKTAEVVKDAATGLIEYLLFFGSFFSAKMEYMGGSGTIKSVRKLIMEYHKDALVRKVFIRLAKDSRIRQLSQFHWRAMIRVFSVAMNCHLYGGIAVGIKLLVLFRIDERLSDTGLRE